jgi:hypothetical protein
MSALDRAVEHFGLARDGEPRRGWHDRSVSLPVRRNETPLWLRVVVARPELARGSWWTGNVDAELIEGIAKPRVIAVHEEAGEGRVVRAELHTRLAGRACAEQAALREDPGLSEQWWDALADGLNALGSIVTDRATTTAQSLRHRIRVFRGPDVTGVARTWRTAHGDLHWANVHLEPFGVVDWEAWGTAPRGHDLATLYLHGLAVPSIGRTMTERFGDELFSESGRVAIEGVATQILARAMSGSHPELVDPIHRVLARLEGTRRGGETDRRAHDHRTSNPHHVNTEQGEIR